ncbi:olfactory receptor 7C1-like [Thunnus maccoyii]|uniref:olfactory receptor 7C1-like n=1 Tax=Thunnus maccoyii TaxID=8240 RepID=UPI001C4C7FB3|nr:olfactory receptor 7C1-like [Thunnus maccoyii]
MTNTSIIVVFSLSGFSATVSYQVTLLSLTLLCYCLILVVNVSLILTIILDQNLHEPMYIFLCNLCINGLYGTAGFYPKFVFDLMSDIHIISYVGCFLQVFVIYSYATIDFSILALMAYDRCVAICRPLEYHSVMSVRRIAVLVSLSWLVPLCFEVMVVTLTSTLKLCGSQIQKLYCENWSIVKLACSTTIANNIVGLIVISFYCGHVLFIVYSYVRIIIVCWKSSAEFKGKVLQSCLPHVISFVICSVTGFCDIALSRYDPEEINTFMAVFLSLEFVVIPPVMNPLVYGLKLPEIRRHILRML